MWYFITAGFNKSETQVRINTYYTLILTFSYKKYFKNHYHPNALILLHNSPVVIFQRILGIAVPACKI